MSDVQGVNVTKFDAGTQDANWIDQGLVKSSVRLWSDVYEAVALAVGQEIGLAQLPDGAIVHDIAVFHDDLIGAGATLEIGDSTTSDRYLTAQVVGGSGSGVIRADQPDGAQYVIGTNPGDGEIIGTVGVNALTGTIKSAVYYTN